MSGADDLIRILGLRPHPEGGWFRETWRAAPALTGSRSPGTAIYFLLRAGERSAWHRLDAAEVWHHYAGAPLALTVAPADGAGGPRRHVLGPDIAGGERPQAIVPAGTWQAAEPLGEWTLVGCTVAPGFDFSGFELAPAGWEPKSA